MKVMQSMENKLMKAIKEVNEGEQQHSTNESSPVTAPKSSTIATSKLSGDTDSEESMGDAVDAEFGLDNAIRDGILGLFSEEAGEVCNLVDFV